MTDYWAPQPPGPGARAVAPYAAPLRPDNRYAWLLVLGPLLYLALEALLGATQLDSAAYRPAVIAMVIILNSVLIRSDAVRVRQAELRLSRLVCFCFVVPAYLAVRAMRDSRTYAILAVWVVAFSLSLPSVGVLQRTLGVRINGVVVERYLGARVQREWNPSFSVDCPDHLRVKVGKAFRCRVVGDPTPEESIEVQVTSLQGRFRACLTDRSGRQESRLWCN